MRTILTTFFLSLALSAFAQDRPIGHPEPLPPTFNKEVVRIFQDRCQTCHRPGEIGPFSLMDYAPAVEKAGKIAQMVASHQMPPWKAVDGCGDFIGERRLSEDELETILAWVGAGAPEGDGADLPPPKQFTDGWAIGEPDLVLTMAEPFTAPVDRDTYRCFPIATDAPIDRWVSAIDVRPGNTKIVHHVISFIDQAGVSWALDDAEEGPGYTCFGGPGFSTTGSLGGWAPGSRPIRLPDDVGLRLPAGATVVLQVHYHPLEEDPHVREDTPSDDDQSDQTSIGVYESAGLVDKPLTILPLINTDFVIPPGEADWPVTASVTLPFPVDVYNVSPHMHLLGREMKVIASDVLQGETCLIQIDDWDFEWQGTYAFREPLSFPAYTTFSLAASFDNSAANPKNPNDPPVAVGWGEETTDEMCIAFLGFTLGDGSQARTDLRFEADR